MKKEPTDYVFLEGYNEARKEFQGDSDSKCQTLSEKMLGDGRDICNPELAKELEEDTNNTHESKLDILAKKVMAAGLDNADYM